MGNILYSIGFNKKNVLSFSKESLPFGILENILINNNNSNLIDFQNQKTFTISNEFDLDFMIKELKNELSLRFEKINIIINEDCNFIDYISDFKRRKAFLRDDFHVDLRVLIKLFISLCQIKDQKKQITFTSFRSDEKRPEVDD